jgi:hypothetical protein
MCPRTANSGKGAVVMLRGRGWAPSETDIIAEIERRELDYPPQ